MARTIGTGIPLGNSIDLNTGAPLDTRVTQADIVGRNAIEWKYDGLKCYVEATKSEYTFVLGHNSGSLLDNSNWVREYENNPYVTAGIYSKVTVNAQGRITNGDYVTPTDVVGLINIGTGKINDNLVPSVAISNTFVRGSQAAMLALTAEEGDICIRTDLNQTFILTTNSPSTLADWAALLSPVDGVTSVSLAMPTGFTVTNPTITSSGTFTVSFTAGYSLPTTIKQGQWDTAYSNNHTHANKAFLDTVISGATLALNITGNAYTSDYSSYATILNTARTIGTITGDATSTGSSFNGSANNSNALTLATVNSNVGSYGSAYYIPYFTVNAKGLITAAGNTAVPQWNQDTTGNAVTWNGNSYLGSTPSAITYVMGYESGVWKPTTNSILQTFLGLGSSAYLTASVTPTANTVVKRDGSGYIEANFFKKVDASVSTGGLFALTGKDNSGSGFLYEFTVGAVTSWLGNYGSWITKAQGDTYYQPIENQRLSTGNRPHFTGITIEGAFNGINQIQFNPSGSGNQWELYPLTTDFTIYNRTSGGTPLSISNAGILSTNGYVVLHSNNFNSYAAPLTGGGTSGTWGISISGNSATSTNSAQWNGMTGYISNSVEVSGLNALIGQHSNGYAYRFNASAVQSFLGLGSNAYTSIAYVPLTGGALINSGTAQTFIEFRNTGGDFYIGKESSTAGGFFSASSAYANVFYTDQPIEFIISGSKPLSVNSLGIGVVGTSTFSGQIYTGVDIQYTSNSGYGIISADGNRRLSITNAGIGIPNITGAVAFGGTTTFNGKMSYPAVPVWSTGTRYFLTLDGSTGDIRYNNLGDAQALLGLGSAAYTASSAYYASGSTVANSTKWNGYNLAFSTTGSVNSYMLSYGSDGFFHVEDQATIRTFLGLGSNAYTSTAYLPLTGGVLENSTTNIFAINSTGATGAYMAWQKSGTSEFYIGRSEAVGGTVGSYDIYTATKGLNFYTNAGLRYTMSASGNHDFKSGTATFGSTVTTQGIYTPYIIGTGGTYLDIYTNSSDGSDNKITRIGGGGDVSDNRGGFITLYGNENTSGYGGIDLRNGNTGYGSTNIHNGATMTSGWTRSLMLNANYPTLVFNSSNSKYAGIGYDYSGYLNFWVNGTSSDLSGTGSVAMYINNSSGVAGFPYGLGTGGKLTWGGGSYSAGIASLYNDASAGTYLIGKTGSTTDFVLVNGVGGGVFEVPTGTLNMRLLGTLSVTGAVTMSSTLAAGATTITGNLSVSGYTTSAGGAGTSDIRHKNVIKDFDYSKLDLSWLDKDRTIAFQWKPEKNLGDKIHFGYSAQELNDWCSDLIFKDNPEEWRVNHIELLTLEIKQLKTKMAKQDARILELEEAR